MHKATAIAFCLVVFFALVSAQETSYNDKVSDLLAVISGGAAAVSGYATATGLEIAEIR
jgi:hypothetical protein